MKLYPKNLGVKWHIAAVRQRAHGPASAWKRADPPRVGVLGRAWVKGMDLPPEVAAHTLPMASGETAGWMYGLGGGLGWMPISGLITALALGSPEWAAVGVAASAFTAWGCAVALPRRVIRNLHETPLRPEELQTLRDAAVPGLPPLLSDMATKFLRRWRGEPSGGTQDELEVAFLDLALQASRLEGLSDATENDVRATLQSVGEAVSSLPPPFESSGGELHDAASLLADADALHARAARETDSVIADSLRRQADTLADRAQATEQNALAIRRVRVLRQELYAQIGTLRATLPTLGRAAALPVAGRSAAAAPDLAFARIADSVRDVAREAVALADAHDELEEALGRAPAAASQAAEAELDGTSGRWRAATNAASITDEQRLRARRGDG